MNGRVGISRYLYLISADRQQISQLQEDIQVYALLRNTVRRGAASVYTSMWRIYLNWVG